MWILSDVLLERSPVADSIGDRERRWPSLSERPKGEGPGCTRHALLLIRPRRIASLFESTSFVRHDRPRAITDRLRTVGTGSHPRVPSQPHRTSIEISLRLFCAHFPCSRAESSCQTRFCIEGRGRKGCLYRQSDNQSEDTSSDRSAESAWANRLGAAAPRQVDCSPSHEYPCRGCRPASGSPNAGPHPTW